MKKPYWSWGAVARWILPLPVLMRLSKRWFGNNHVWYQDAEVQLELRPRREWVPPGFPQADLGKVEKCEWEKMKRNQPTILWTDADHANSLASIITVDYGDIERRLLTMREVELQRLELTDFHRTELMGDRG